MIEVFCVLLAIITILCVLLVRARLAAASLCDTLEKSTKCLESESAIVDHLNVKIGSLGDEVVRLGGSAKAYKDLWDAAEKRLAEFRATDDAKIERRIYGMRDRQNELVAELAGLTAALEARTKEAEKHKFDAGWAQSRRAVAEARVVVAEDRVREAETQMKVMREARALNITAAVPVPEGPLSSAALKDGVTSSDVRSGLAIVPKGPAKRRVKKP